MKLNYSTLAFSIVAVVLGTGRSFAQEGYAPMGSPYPAGMPAPYDPSGMTPQGYGPGPMGPGPMMGPAPYAQMAAVPDTGYATQASYDPSMYEPAGDYVQYENVAGARSNALPGHVPAEVKQDRWDRFMEKAQAISEAKLAAKVGKRMDVIVDLVEDDAATCRTKADAPEIDGNLFIDEGHEGLTAGDIVTVEVDEAGEYDLWGRLV